MEPPVVQLHEFLATVAMGLLSGFCYDLYRIIGQRLRLRRWGVLVGDLLFWLLLTVLVFMLLYLSNAAEVRFYVFIGIILGALVYLRFLSAPVTKAVNTFLGAAARVGKFAGKVFYFLWLAVKKPAQLVFVLTSFPFRVILMFLGKIFYPLKRVIDKICGPVFGPLLAPFKRLADRVFSILFKKFIK